jgi:hypothetical protein
MSTSFFNRQPLAITAATRQPSAGLQIANFDLQAVALATAVLAGNTGAAAATTPNSPDTTSLAPPTPGELQELLSRIPVAEDGNVIRSEYHNSLRAALLAIARSLGITTDMQAVTQTFTPNFFPVGAQALWVMSAGIADKAAVGNGANGWMPVQLPNGARLMNMRVMGRRVGAVSAFQVKLVRQRIIATTGANTGTTLTTLFDADLLNAGDPFNIMVDVEEPNNVSGAAVAAIIEDFRLVDNDRYKYMITAELSGAVNLAQLHAIQLIYRR